MVQVANGHWRHLGPATSRPLLADARKALSGAGGQWPPVTSRPGGGKLPPKDLEAGDWLWVGCACIYREWSSGLGEKIKQRNSYLSIDEYI